MDVYWLEQTEADVPAENDWLCASELAVLSGLRIAKRRSDWRRGRWTAKRAVAACLNVAGDRRALAAIEVRPAASGAPEVFLAGQPTVAAISLSHCSDRAVCAVAAPGGALGCDLEMIEPRSDGFIADYFTGEEQAMVARTSPADRFRLVTLLWSAKESALKALCEGLRLDTRSVEVNTLDQHPPSEAIDGWRPLEVRYTSGQTFQGWWRQAGSLLWSMVAAPPPLPPVVLNLKTL